MPDSARWWGDETGQIIELKAELHDGYAHIPIGLGSTVAVTNGIVRGNSWLAAIIYGIPATLFASQFDLVSIGRTITALLSLLLVALLLVALRKFNVDRVLTLFVILLLISTRSFFFASHAARLDVAAGLALLGVVVYLSRRYEEWQAAHCQPSEKWFFIVGAGMLLLATLSIHLLTLLAPIALLALYHFGAFRKWSLIGAAIGGAAAVALLLFVIYYLSGAPITLFGATQLHTQFHSVIDEIPITKLFSPNAQIGNVFARWEGFVAEAPAVLGLAIAAVVLTLVRIKHVKLSLGERFALQSCILAIVSWLLLESYAIYYYMQVLPLIVFVSALLIARSLPAPVASRSVRVALLIASILISYVALTDATLALTSGSRVTTANHQALKQAVSNIPPTGDVILAQNPSLAWLLHRTNMKVMSSHFLEFPITDRAPADVMKAEHVKYLLLYVDPKDKNYSFEVPTMMRVADSVGELIATQHGALLDVDRNYFALDTSRVDTLKLYKLKW